MSQSISALDLFKKIESIVKIEVSDVRDKINNVLSNNISITNKAIETELKKIQQYSTTLDRVKVESSEILSGLSPTELQELITLAGYDKKSKIESNTTFGVAGDKISKSKELITSKETFEATKINYSEAKAQKFRDYLAYIQLGHNTSAATKKLETVVAELYAFKLELQDNPNTHPNILKALDAIIKVNRLGLVADTLVDKGLQKKIGPNASTITVAKYLESIKHYASPKKTKEFESKYKDSFIRLDVLKNNREAGTTLDMKISLSVENAWDNYAKAIYSQKINEVVSAMSLEIAALFGSSTVTRAKLVKTIHANKLYTQIVQELKQAEKSSLIKLEKEILDSDLINLTSSPSLKDIIQNNILNILQGKKVNNARHKNTQNKNIQNKSNTNTTDNGQIAIDALVDEIIKINSKSRNIKQLPNPLRTPQGQFTSVTKLENLIRAQLRPTVVKNMHRPNLEYQTGRFADSVKLETISRARDGALTAFLSYMRYPYATFEKDGRQGKKGYYPSRLIEGSVREIASKLVRDRMRVVIQ